MEIRSIVDHQIEKVKEITEQSELVLGEILFNNNECQILSQSPVSFDLMVSISNESRQAGLSLQVVTRLIMLICVIPMMPIIKLPNKENYYCNF